MLGEQLRDVLLDNARPLPARFGDIFRIARECHLCVGMPERCAHPENVLARANHRCGECVARVIDAAVGDLAFFERPLPAVGEAAAARVVFVAAMHKDPAALFARIHLQQLGLDAWQHVDAALARFGRGNRAKCRVALDMNRVIVKVDTIPRERENLARVHSCEKGDGREVAHKGIVAEQNLGDFFVAEGCRVVFG